MQRKSAFRPTLADAAVEIDIAFEFKEVFRNTSPFGSFARSGVTLDVRARVQVGSQQNPFPKYVSRGEAEVKFKVSLFSFRVKGGEGLRYRHPVLKAPPHPTP